MLETLMNLVRQSSGDAIVNNPAIPNEHNDEAMQTVMSGITGGMQQEVSNGNLGGLMGMLLGKGGSVEQNPVTGNIASNVGGQLQQRFGISSQTAMSIAAAVVPMILGKLVHKANDPNDGSVDVNSVMGSVTGKGGIDWAGMAGSAMADGRLDTSDLMRVAGDFMKGGGNNSGQQGGAGGLGGMLGGLFGGR